MAEPSTPSSNPPSLPITEKPIEDPLPLPLPLSLVATQSPSPPPSTVLLLSPSPQTKSKTRLADRLEMVAEESPEPAGIRRRCKTKPPQIVSPKNPRKSRRQRSEIEIREDNKDVGLVEEVGKPRKRRNSGRPKKEKSNFTQPSTSTPKAEEENGVDIEYFGQLVSDLVMWKDGSKSAFWFGFGCLCLLSSCFTQGLNFSIVSASSQLAILFLGVSFLRNSIFQRNCIKEKSEVKLKEDDILCLAKLILPALNLAISMARMLFSGEPSTTLKVAPLLLLGAEFGHFITIWRLCVIGFFVSFSIPKLYSCYSTRIDHRAECLKLWLWETWCACTHKKKMMAFTLLTFWNLSSIKTRIFTAFMLLVLFRYLKQHVVQQLQALEAQEVEKEQQQSQQLQALEAQEVEKEQQQSQQAQEVEKEHQQAPVPKQAP